MGPVPLGKKGVFFFTLRHTGLTPFSNSSACKGHLFQFCTSCCRSWEPLRPPTPFFCSLRPSQSFPLLPAPWSLAHVCALFLPPIPRSLPLEPPLWVPLVWPPAQHQWHQVLTPRAGGRCRQPRKSEQGRPGPRRGPWPRGRLPLPSARLLIQAAALEWETEGRLEPEGDRAAVPHMNRPVWCLGGEWLSGPLLTLLPSQESSAGVSWGPVTGSEVRRLQCWGPGPTHLRGQCLQQFWPLLRALGCHDSLPGHAGHSLGPSEAPTKDPYLASLPNHSAAPTNSRGCTSSGLPPWGTPRRQ